MIFILFNALQVLSAYKIYLVSYNSLLLTIFYGLSLSLNFSNEKHRPLVCITMELIMAHLLCVMIHL